jgi:hypothetical protein
MSMRVPFILMVPLAVLGCAHGSSESVASKSSASSASSSASSESVKAGEVVDEGPSRASAGAGAGAGAASASSGQLIPFHSSGGFTVLMPANPVQQNRTEQTPGGPVQIHVAQAADPAAQYVSTYSDFPPGSLEKVKTSELLDAFQRSTLQATNGTLVGSRDIQVDGLPGREFTASQADGGQMTARLLVAPGRVYSLAGTYPQGQPPASVQRFLGSFARTPEGGPAVAAAARPRSLPAATRHSRGERGDRSGRGAPGEASGKSPRGTEVPAGNADPSAPTRRADRSALG